MKKTINGSFFHITNRVRIANIECCSDLQTLAMYVGLLGKKDYLAENYVLNSPFVYEKIKKYKIFLKFYLSTPIYNTTLL